MTISWISVGANGNGSTSVTPQIPASVAAGDLLVLAVANKYPANGPSTPAGWTLAGQTTGGHGSAAANAGSVICTVFYKVADGSESGNLTVSVPSANVTTSRINRYTKSAAGVWAISAGALASNNTPGTSWSAAGAANPGITTDDRVFVASAINSNSFTFSAEAMAATGLVMGNQNERSDSNSATGDHCGLVTSDHVITSGPASSVPTFTMTASSSTADSPAGATVIVRLRENIPAAARSHRRSRRGGVTI